MTRFISWNIDSLNAALTSDSARAELSRDVLRMIGQQGADLIAIQETKLPPTGPSEKHLEVLEEFFPDYDYVFRCSTPPARKSYAGTMILYKKGLEPKVIEPKIGAPSTMDEEGRLLVLELDDFYFANVYTPNAGNELCRLGERQDWDRCYADYLAELDRTKPVIATGDYNCAHEEIDLANPKTNHFSAGFTDEEREGFSNLLAKGFTDSFRFLHGPEAVAYSWFSQRIKTCKTNNVGWRIDYFLVSDRIKDRIERSEMLDSGERRDHGPILLEMEL